MALSLFISCKGDVTVDSQFLDNFYTVTKEELIKDVVVPNVDKNLKTDYVIDAAILSKYFLIPVNEVNNLVFVKRYKPLYKCKFTNEVYLISYLEEWGSLTECKQFLCTYDVKSDRVLSRIVIYLPHGLNTIDAPHFDGKTLTLKIVSSQLKEGGIDKKEPYKLHYEKYSITNGYFQKQL